MPNRPTAPGSGGISGTATDPIPQTPENEALDQYFTRVAIANERFKDEGGAGWRTDRGEVYTRWASPTR